MSSKVILCDITYMQKVRGCTSPLFLCLGYHVEPCTGTHFKPYNGSDWGAQLNDERESSWLLFVSLNSRNIIPWNTPWNNLFGLTFDKVEALLTPCYYLSPIWLYCAAENEQMAQLQTVSDQFNDTVKSVKWAWSEPMHMCRYFVWLWEQHCISLISIS